MCSSIHGINYFSYIYLYTQTVLSNLCSAHRFSKSILPIRFFGAASKPFTNQWTEHHPIVWLPGFNMHYFNSLSPEQFGCSGTSWWTENLMHIKCSTFSFLSQSKSPTLFAQLLLITSNSFAKWNVLHIDTERKKFWFFRTSIKNDAISGRTTKKIYLMDEDDNNNLVPGKVHDT
jgi:hypothetical protein